MPKVTSQTGQALTNTFSGIKTNKTPKLNHKDTSILKKITQRILPKKFTHQVPTKSLTDRGIKEDKASINPLYDHKQKNTEQENPYYDHKQKTTEQENPYYDHKQKTTEQENPYYETKNDITEDSIDEDMYEDMYEDIDSLQEKIEDSEKDQDNTSISDDDDPHIEDLPENKDSSNTQTYDAVDKDLCSDVKEGTVDNIEGADNKHLEKDINTLQNEQKNLLEKAKGKLYELEEFKVLSKCLTALEEPKKASQDIRISINLPNETKPIQLFPLTRSVMNRSDFNDLKKMAEELLIKHGKNNFPNFSITAQEKEINVIKNQLIDLEKSINEKGISDNTWENIFNQYKQQSIEIKIDIDNKKDDISTPEVIVEDLRKNKKASPTKPEIIIEDLRKKRKS